MYRLSWGQSIFLHLKNCNALFYILIEFSFFIFILLQNK